MENKDDFLKDWLEGKISAEELKVRKEKGDAFVQDFDELITKSAGLKVPEKTTQEEAWNKLSAKLSEAPKAEAKVVKLNRWVPISIAASISLLVLAFLLWNNVTVTSQLAETKVYQLPDGSEVTLNADSKISYSRFGFTGNRVVELEGEAFFHVTKGNSFVVENEKGTVSVLGTSFNVQARSATFEVSCFTGKVKVANSESEVILTKGLYTTLLETKLSAAESFNDTKTTWRTGDFYFESKPLSLVIEELQRQFNIEITFSGDSNRLYTGYFSNKNLDQALELVFKPMSLTYERQNNKIIVK